MWKRFTFEGNQKWMKLLPVVVSQYNNKIHSSIKTTPKDASENPEKSKNIKVQHNNENLKSRKSKFRLNDRVRIYKYQYKFTKGFVSKWTDEIFRIVQINYGNPSTYVLEDTNGDIIDESFYERITTHRLLKNCFSL